MITKGLGTNLLITKGLGQMGVIPEPTRFIDPYCNACTPYVESAPVARPFTRIGTCLSIVYDKINTWQLQLKLMLNATYSLR
jgi:hypothetical protein